MTVEDIDRKLAEIATTKSELIARRTSRTNRAIDPHAEFELRDMQTRLRELQEAESNLLEQKRALEGK